jgi:hypothetical protein
MLVAVEVGVALSRPPRVDRISKVLVEAPTEIEAQLLACQIACRRDVVMPVYSQVLDVLAL